MSAVPEIMARIDAFAATEVKPLYGWHDDHRGRDRTPDYRPALQQVRAEFEQLLNICEEHGCLGGRALQLGLGRGGAAHVALRCAFGLVCSIDADPTTLADLYRNWPCREDRDVLWCGATGTIDVLAAARAAGPYDLLLIDANHSENGVRRDYLDYGPLVRRGGVIAFHDALKRPTYEEEITVWKFLAALPAMNMIGSEVGIAWRVQP